jgi:hypothetical protein
VRANAGSHCRRLWRSRDSRLRSCPQRHTVVIPPHPGPLPEGEGDNSRIPRLAPRFPGERDHFVSTLSRGNRSGKFATRSAATAMTWAP